MTKAQKEIKTGTVVSLYDGKQYMVFKPKTYDQCIFSAIILDEKRFALPGDIDDKDIKEIIREMWLLEFFYRAISGKMAGQLIVDTIIHWPFRRSKILQ